MRWPELLTWSYTNNQPTIVYFSHKIIFLGHHLTQLKQGLSRPGSNIDQLYSYSVLVTGWLMGQPVESVLLLAKWKITSRVHTGCRKTHFAYLLSFLFCSKCCTIWLSHMWYWFQVGKQWNPFLMKDSWTWNQEKLIFHDFMFNSLSSTHGFHLFPFSCFEPIGLNRWKVKTWKI